MAASTTAADAAFRASLNPDLVKISFEIGSTASNVEQSIQEIIKRYTSALPHQSLHVLIYHGVARTLRAVLSSWRLLPSVDGEREPGYVVDKFDYGYTAMHAIRPKNNQPETLEYRVVRCLTEEFQRESQITGGMLQGIIDGASKQYLCVVQSISAAGGDGFVDLVREVEVETACYQALLRFPLTTPSTSSPKRKAAQMEGDEVDEAMRKRACRTPKKITKATAFGDKPGTDRAGSKERKDVESPSATPESKRRPGNWNHSAFIRWNYEETHWVEQLIRGDPWLTWSTLAERLNVRFKGTMFYAGKQGMVQRDVRSLNAVQRKFQDFRQKMRDREKNSEPTQGTQSDVELEQDLEPSPDRPRPKMSMTKRPMPVRTAQGSGQRMLRRIIHILQ